MSHFTVAVFSRKPDDVDELLKPFYEAHPAGSPYMEFVEDETVEVDDVTQKRGYWHNPQGYWDWWTVGGRWCGMLRLKDGCKGVCGERSWANADFVYAPGMCDQARVADCDFAPDSKAYAKAQRFWEIVVEHAPRRDDESDFLTFLRDQYYIDLYGTKEAYATHEARFHPYAYITADGKWIAPGRVGFFGTDDSTMKSQLEYDGLLDDYLKQAAEESLYITIVDCHI